MKKIIEKVRSDIKNSSNPETQAASQHFFKEAIKCYGVKSADMGKIIRENFKLIKDLPKKEIFNLCEEFWKSGYLEESFVACNWSFLIHKQYSREDFALFETWIDKYIKNWASCDTFCNHNMGEFIEMYPEYISELKRFAKSKNLWLRRAAAVSFIVPARKGKFIEDIFEIAEILLTDKEDMVQKGYGWMLKVASQTYEKEVFDYVMKNKAIMPRTSLRYAIEKMPKGLKDKAMSK